MKNAIPKPVIAGIVVVLILLVAAGGWSLFRSSANDGNLSGKTITPKPWHGPPGGAARFGKGGPIGAPQQAPAGAADASAGDQAKG